MSNTTVFDGDEYSELERLCDTLTSLARDWEASPIPEYQRAARQLHDILASGGGHRRALRGHDLAGRCSHG